jgi:hypothetical protein
VVDADFISSASLILPTGRKHGGPFLSRHSSHRITMSESRP